MAVVTVVHGRHDHLRGQLEGLRRQTRRPDLLVVVAMDDDRVPAVVDATAGAAHVVHHVPIPRQDGRLPLAAARNLGVSTAVAAGAEHLVLLDVDCVPAPTLVERYAEVLTTGDGDGPVLLCGGVAYEADPREGPRPPRHHPARPPLPRTR
ncbi:glycosyltransferase family 2 protein [Phycicoccus sp. HDW14]|uniref:glycosyltransferase family 2 protein n=1 Tax=Phycicoccus sp. HDW14 TaxID=2714941 RepID=UPI001F0E8B1B|nr:glycosyltransferase family A protein [Phycicoccus sp. HDW14]